MVTPPARTGNESSSKKAVIKTDQTNKGTRLHTNPRALILKIVTIKLIAPLMDEIPAKCKLKIAKSTAGLECAEIPDSGGYSVQPVPAPPSTKLEVSNSIRAGAVDKN